MKNRKVLNKLIILLIMAIGGNYLIFDYAEGIAGSIAIIFTVIYVLMLLYLVPIEEGRGGMNDGKVYV